MCKKFKRTYSEAFLYKFKSVAFFNEHYAKSPCLISEGILRTHDKLNKKFVLVRLFVDLDSIKNQSYVIFMKQTEDMITLDLVSAPNTFDEIILKHQIISPDCLVYGKGQFNLEAEMVVLQNKPEDVLSAALLWAGNLKTNLGPENGLDVINELLKP